MSGEEAKLLFHAPQYEKDYASFWVADDGEGIPEQQQSHIFDPFFTTKQAGEGTGLGLSITKEIIQAHNENINVISTEGVGTEFIFSLSKTKR